MGPPLVVDEGVTQAESASPRAPAVDPDLAERLPKLIQETLSPVPGGLSLALPVFLLRGSEGPATIDRRDRYGITTWGALRAYSFAEVRAAVEQLVEAGALRLSGGTVCRVYGPSQVVGKAPPSS